MKARPPPLRARPASAHDGTAAAEFTEHDDVMQVLPREIDSNEALTEIYCRDCWVWKARPEENGKEKSRQNRVDRLVRRASGDAD
jgi:hypothetical protein